jgi:ribosomal protein L37AE/L43A
MLKHQCPKCGSTNVVARTVNDRLRAADPMGEPFEIALQLLVWSCRACKLCWQGDEAMVAKEAAYQYAILKRSAGRTDVQPVPRYGNRQWLGRAIDGR